MAQDSLRMREAPKVFRLQFTPRSGEDSGGRADVARSQTRSLYRVSSWFLSERPAVAFWRTVVFAVVTIVISGLGHAMRHPGKVEQTDVDELIASLVAGEATPEVVPRDFSPTLGYRPESNGKMLFNPHGGCSTPGFESPEAFGLACRTHDLGYDALRYAERSGGSVGFQARFDLDQRLYVGLLDTCETARCRALATAYFTAVTANSIRQGYKAPTQEPTLPWAALAIGATGLAWAPVLAWPNRSGR